MLSPTCLFFWIGQNLRAGPRWASLRLSYLDRLYEREHQIELSDPTLKKVRG